MSNEEKIPLFKRDIKITDRVSIRIELVESDLLQIGVVEQTGKKDVTEVNNAARMFLNHGSEVSQAIQEAIAIGCALVAGEYEKTVKESEEWLENQ